MSGTCAATKITVAGHGRHRRATNLVVVDPRTGDEIRITHPRELEAHIADLAADGITYDGTAYDLPPGETVASVGDRAADMAVYADPATLRGRYGHDVGTHTRHRISRAVSRVAEHWDLDDDDLVLRDLRNTLTDSLRSDGWPDEGHDALVARLAERYPGLSMATRAIDDTNRTIIESRVPTAGDLAAVAAYLSNVGASKGLYRGDDNLTDLAREAVGVTERRAALVRFGPDGRVISFTLSDVGGPEKGVALTGLRYVPPAENGGLIATSAAELAATAVLKTRHRHMQAAFDADGDLCFTCSTRRRWCECRTIAAHSVRSDQAGNGSELVAHYSQTIDRAAGRDTVEHRWGELFARRPDAGDHIAARARTGDVSDMMRTALGVEHDEIVAKLGSTAAYNIALFATQTGATDDEVAALIPHLCSEMNRAVDRADQVHGEYGEVLADEFDGGDASISDQRSEIYLGRDGIYPLIARRAWRATKRWGVDGGARSDGRDAENQLVYLRVSRMCSWNADQHHDLLGDHDPVFVDTGYAGSIPRMILGAEGRTDTASTTGAGGAARSDYIRLLCATEPANGFATQYSDERIEMIEHDAKPDRSATAVDVSEPSGALEQLIYRQLRHRIAANATDAARGDTHSAKTPAQTRSEHTAVPPGAGKWWSPASEVDETAAPGEITDALASSWLDMGLITPDDEAAKKITDAPVAKGSSGLLAKLQSVLTS